MTEIDHSTLSINDLLELFKKSCIAQDETLFLPEDIEIYNAQYDVLVAIKNALKARGPEARRSLLRLFDDDNPQVRLQSAQFVYPVARDEAKKCLQDIKAAKLPFQSLCAGMALWGLEENPHCLDN